MQKLKPFNLERALAGDAVVTKRGNKAQVVYVSKIESEFPVLVVILDSNGEEVEWYTQDGSYRLQHESGLDLFMVDNSDIVSPHF